MGGGCAGQFACHSEVDPEPGIGAKAEEHLFTVGVGGAEMATMDGAGEKGGGGFAKDTFL